MFEFQEKRKIRKVAYSVPVLIILALIVLGVGKATWSVYLKSREGLANLDRAESELSKLDGRERFLASEILRLGTDRGVEEEIREKFPVAKEGEVVVLIIDPDKAESEDVQSGGASISLWQKFLLWFK